MEVKIKKSELQKRSLFVATPMYGGMCNGQYTESMIKLSVAAAQYGVKLRNYFIFNESLITRARNYCVDEFLRSGFTHLMFIDSDIRFNPDDVFTMLALMDNDSDYDVMAGPYPKKSIAWEKVKDAVDKGFADENPLVLEQFTGDFVFNAVKSGEVKITEPVEVLEAGTGFMMIKRDVFERYKDAYSDEIMYYPDHVRSKHFDGSHEIGMYFQAAIDEKSKRYLSEDYWFCQRSRGIGIKIWMCPWMKLTHSGHYEFRGSLPALAAIGAPATVDPKKIKKKGNEK